MDSLRVAEIFSSIQGEGIWVGTPSTFVRVSGCNLRCVWCDTPYASWRPEGPVTTVPQIVAEVRRRGIEHVVLTGGEPMLFEPIEELAAELKACGHVLTIETAGTVFRQLPCDLMSISPKLSNSTPGSDAGPGWTERHEKTRLDIEPLKMLLGKYDYQLKFVVNPESSTDDIAEVHELLSRLDGSSRERVLLMAEGVDAETLHRRERLLAPICLKEGWKLTPRFHIDLFGNARGT